MQALLKGAGPLGDPGKPMTIALRIEFVGPAATRITTAPDVEILMFFLRKTLDNLSIPQPKGIKIFKARTDGAINMFWDTNHGSQLLRSFSLAVEKTTSSKLRDNSIGSMTVYHLPPNMTTIPGNFVVPVSILRGFVQTPSKTVMPSFETASSSSSPVLAPISTASSSHSAPATATQPPVQASPPLPPVLPSASPFTRSLEAENDRLQQALHVVSLELRNTRDEVVKLRSQATEALEQQKADRSRLAVSQTQVRVLEHVQERDTTLLREAAERERALTERCTALEANSDEAAGESSTRVTALVEQVIELERRLKQTRAAERAAILRLLQMQEPSFVDEVKDIDMQSALDLLEDYLQRLRSAQQTVESQLEEERKGHQRVLHNIEAECKAPFVVPALLEAFVAMSAMSDRLLR